MMMKWIKNYFMKPLTRKDFLVLQVVVGLISVLITLGYWFYALKWDDVKNWFRKKKESLKFGKHYVDVERE